MGLRNRAHYPAVAETSNQRRRHAGLTATHEHQRVAANELSSCSFSLSLSDVIPRGTNNLAMTFTVTTRSQGPATANSGCRPMDYSRPVGAAWLSQGTRNSIPHLLWSTIWPPPGHDYCALRGPSDSAKVQLVDNRQLY